MKIRWDGIFLYWIVFPLILIFCDLQTMPEVLWQQLNQVGCMHQKLLAKQNWKTFLLVDLLKNGSTFKNSKIKNNNNNKKRELQKNVPFFGEEKPNLSPATRSFGANPSGSSFVLGNKTTGMPLSLAYTEPPQPATQEKNTYQWIWKRQKQMFMHESFPVPELFSVLIKHNKHDKLAGNANLPFTSISFNGPKSQASGNQFDGRTSKRTCPSTYRGN